MWLLGTFTAALLAASLAHAAVLEYVSPLEMLASVMGSPITMPSTTGGKLEFGLVAGLPWVPLPAGAQRHRPYDVS